MPQLDNGHHEMRCMEFTDKAVGTDTVFPPASMTAGQRLSQLRWVFSTLDSVFKKGDNALRNLPVELLELSLCVRC